jgi:CheY-like chemotaxis protein
MNFARAGRLAAAVALPQIPQAGGSRSPPRSPAQPRPGCPARWSVRLARAARAYVVLMDISMSILDGLAASRLITQDEDLAGVKVLILTTS